MNQSDAASILSKAGSSAKKGATTGNNKADRTEKNVSENSLERIELGDRALHY